MNGSRITVGMLAAVILLLAALYPYIYITSRPTTTTVTATVTTATTVTVTTTTPFITLTVWTMTKTVERPLNATVSIYAFGLFEVDPEIDVTLRNEYGELVAYAKNLSNTTKYGVLIVAVCREDTYIDVFREVIQSLEPNVTMKVQLGYAPLFGKCVAFAAR